MRKAVNEMAREMKEVAGLGGSRLGRRRAGEDAAWQFIAKYYGITGAELRAERKVALLSQATLAERAGIGRQAVIYWERKSGKFWRGWAIQRMCARGQGYYCGPTSSKRCWISM